MTTRTFIRDPRVAAAATAIAGVDSRRSRIKTPTDKPSASDFHEAVVAVKAIDEASTSAVAAVLALHTPVRRYRAATRLDTHTYPTAERAHQVNTRHSMRGFEALVMATQEDVPFIEVCAECSRVENASTETVNGYGEDHDDHQDGTELSMKASVWPCATYTALNSAPAQPSLEAKALAAVASVLERWQNGALINKGAYEGITWVEPLSPLPPGADEIREALKQAGIQ
ncbi:hypothetical protein [Paenarthrobacter sp. YJN-5]|uniref:hypothetical protein n=1 Tax=Paenarthrobacter sp. YJN-5 TaxID=2735316 RepID=UPI001877EFB2|nr:hypothetical protein [Paenarthrobacter sp. YJN-5]QOT19572.1 hypothetical protein HMI59_23390 [Paenarthrobacter sp. YJN-5]